MSQDFKLFLSTLSEARVVDGISAWGALGFSAEARRRRRQFRHLRGIFESAFSDPDTAIQIQIRGGRSKPIRNGGTWAIAVALFSVAFMVWSRFTLPGLTDWFATMIHRCGMK